MPKSSKLAPALMIAVLAAGALTACDDDTETADSGSATTGCSTPASDSFTRPFEVDEQDYPFHSCAFETPTGTVHYIDDAPRDASKTILMVHGNPTWSFLYRNIAEAMIEDGYRVIALDHLGMGMSDVPPTSAFDYRPRSHADHLEDLVVALDLRDVTIVVQDWGGPIGLGMATRHPDRIASLLIMNTWAWSIDPEAPGDYHALVGWYEQARRLPTFSPTAFCDFALTGQSELNAAEVDPSRGALYERVLAAYLSPAIDPVSRDYRTEEPCAPMQIFAESIIDDDAFQGELEGRIGALRGKHYALLFGLSDPLFGALRCDQSADSPCPASSACVCNEALLPARVSGGCSDPMANEFHVCEQPDGSIIEPYADRFEELLGSETLVLREGVEGADHMIQEWAPDRVIQALRALLTQEELRP